MQCWVDVFGGCGFFEAAAETFWEDSAGSASGLSPGEGPWGRRMELSTLTSSQFFWMLQTDCENKRGMVACPVLGIFGLLRAVFLHSSCAYFDVFFTSSASLWARTALSSFPKKFSLRIFIKHAQEFFVYWLSHNRPSFI